MTAARLSAVAVVAGGSVFVHCHWVTCEGRGQILISIVLQGQSRSATLILAYMMHKVRLLRLVCVLIMYVQNQISFDKAIGIMRQTRPEAKPNSGSSALDETRGEGAGLSVLFTAFQYQLRKFGAELGLEPKPEQPGHLSDSD